MIKNKLWKDYTPEEKTNLLLSAKSNDKMALTEIWKSVVGAIYEVAIRFQHNSGSLSVDDLVMGQYQTFDSSIKSFSESGGADFLTYLIGNVQRSIPRVITEEGHAIKIPLHVSERYHKIKKAIVELQYDKVTDENVALIMAHTGIIEDHIWEAVGYYRANPSVNQESNFLFETEQNEEDENALDYLDKLKTNLTIAEWEIMKKILDIDTDIQYTKKMIQKEFNISRRSVDKVVDKARAILKKGKED